jgi:hypothetical protein
VQVLALLIPVVIALPNPKQSLHDIQALGPLAPVSILATLAIYPWVGAAINRSVLSPDADRFGALRFGAAEPRQVVITLINTLVLIGVFTGLLLAWVYLIGLIYPWLWSTFGAGEGLSVAMGLTVALIIVAATLAIAAAQTFAAPLVLTQGWVSPVAAWALVRGRFWRIYAALIVVLLVSLVLWFLALIAMSLIDAAYGAPFNGADTFTKPDIISPALLRTPARLWSEVVMGGLVSLLSVLWQAPAATLYRQIIAVEADRASVVDMFD